MTPPHTPYGSRHPELTDACVRALADVVIRFVAYEQYGSLAKARRALARRSPSVERERAGALLEPACEAYRRAARYLSTPRATSHRSPRAKFSSRRDIDDDEALASMASASLLPDALLRLMLEHAIDWHYLR